MKHTYLIIVFLLSFISDSRGQDDIFLFNTQPSCSTVDDGSVSIYVTEYALLYDWPVPFIMIWTHEKGKSGEISIIQTGAIDSLPAGRYEVEVEVSDSCIVYTEFYINVITVDIKADVSIPSASTNCNDGSIDLKVKAGENSYSYNWILEGFPATELDSSASLNSLGAGTYCVTVTEDSGCTNSKCFDLYNLDCCSQLPQIYQQSQSSGMMSIVGQTIFPSAMSCEDGSVDIQINGGLPPYRVGWYQFGVLIQSAESIMGQNDGEDISDIGLGYYTIVVYDSKCDQAEASFGILGGGSLISVVSIQNVTTCYYDERNPREIKSTEDGSITVAIDYEGAYTIQWIGSNSTSTVAKSLGPGTYTVIVTTAEGCVDQLDIELCCCEGADIGGSGEGINYCGDGFGFPLVVQSSTKTSATNGTSYDGSLSVDVFGGSGSAITYSWSGPPGNYDPTTPSIQNLGPGFYCVDITDGCSSIQWCDSIIDCSLDPITVDAIIRNTCYDVGAGEINVFIIGGRLPYTISWTFNGADISPNSNIISNLYEGQYCVSIADVNGCSMDSCFNVIADEEAMEEDLEDCNFEFQCMGFSIAGTQREGVIESEFDKVNCHIIYQECVDDFYASGSKTLADLKTKPEFSLNHDVVDSETGCPIMLEICIGPDGILGTSDDKVFGQVFPVTTPIDLFDMYDDDASASCNQCWFVTLCDYDFTDSYRWPDEERYALANPVNMAYIEVVGTNASICLDTSHTTDCTVDLLCPLSANPLTSFLWDQRCFPTDACGTWTDQEFMDGFNVCQYKPTLKEVLSYRTPAPIQIIPSNASMIDTMSAEIEDINNIYKIKVYPNPFKDLLTIELEGFHINSPPNLEVIIYDSMGRVHTKRQESVFSTPHDELKIQINTADVENGVYYLQVLHNHAIVGVKTIVKL